MFRLLLSIVSLFVFVVHAVAVSSIAAAATSPISRVVQLLRGLSQQIEKDQKTEEGLYEKYICWAQNVISQKEASIEESKPRISSLEVYESNLDMGRGELSKERKTLKKEIASLTSEIETATALRKSEARDFTAARAEMDKAIDSLKAALKVLRHGGDRTLLLDSGTGISGSAAIGAQDRQLLPKAIAIGQEALGKGDALFLRRILSGAVLEQQEQRDDKHSGRKASLRRKSDARASKIEKLLRRLIDNFSAARKEAKDRDDSAWELHDELMEAKRGQKREAEGALGTMEKEDGSRSMTRSETDSELQDLKAQVKADTKHLKDTKAALAHKIEDYNQRRQLQAGELEAISKAISILTADDARDLLKKTVAAQGFFFLQERATLATTARSRDAADLLRRLSQDSRDPRLAGLALLATSTHFDAVLKAVESMVAEIKQAQEEDLKLKEACEEHRTKDTREAVKLARSMDDISDASTDVEAKAAEMEAEIESKKETIKDIVSQLSDSAAIRAREHQDYLQATAEDRAAKELIGDAKKVLEEYYAEKLSLLQGQQHFMLSDPEEISAGEAPPPPPDTWDRNYNGKRSESEGIISMLMTIKDDLQTDLDKAKKNEDGAKVDYDKMKADLEDDKSSLDTDISTLEGTESSSELDLVASKRDRKTIASELKPIMQKIEDAGPSCDFIAINYAVREKNRQIELQGLKKAKLIIKSAKSEAGGSFLQTDQVLLASARHSTPAAHFSTVPANVARRNGMLQRKGN